MLRSIFFASLLVLANNACAQKQPELKCDYNSQVITNLPALDNARITSEVKGIDPDSMEKTITHTFKFNNGDIAVVEQKFCLMYNFQIVYKLKSLSQKNFDQGLTNIDKLIKNVHQDYQLKSPLNTIVDMTMNQKKLSLNTAFSYDLPVQAIISGDNVENNFSFRLLNNKELFEAEIEFYFGLGGE